MDCWCCVGCLANNLDYIYFSNVTADVWCREKDGVEALKKDSKFVINSDDEEEVRKVDTSASCVCVCVCVCVYVCV